MLGVGFGSLLPGLTTAAIVSFFNFPGKVFIKNFNPSSLFQALLLEQFISGF